MPGHCDKNPAAPAGFFFDMTFCHPKKLHNSKWTATRPRNREKHFIVKTIVCDTAGQPLTCMLESVYTRRTITLDWHELLDGDKWRIGWR